MLRDESSEDGHLCGFGRICAPKEFEGRPRQRTWKVGMASMWIFVRVTNERKGTSQVRSKELEGNGLLKVRFFRLSGGRRILCISSILCRGFEWFADLPKAALFFGLSVIPGRRLPGCRYHTLKSLRPSTSPGFLGFRISGYLQLPCLSLIPAFRRTTWLIWLWGFPYSGS